MRNIHDSNRFARGGQPGLLAQRTVGPRQLRAELEDLVGKELLGPRGGPDEEVTESRLQDRYLADLPVHYCRAVSIISIQ